MYKYIHSTDADALKETAKDASLICHQLPTSRHGIHKAYNVDLTQDDYEEKNR